MRCERCTSCRPCHASVTGGMPAGGSPDAVVPAADPTCLGKVTRCHMKCNCLFLMLAMLLSAYGALNMSAERTSEAAR